MTDDLEKNYSKAMYHSPQKYGHKLAIIFVDFANAYFDESCPLYGGEGCKKALESSKRLLSFCRNYTQIPIVFTEVKYIKGGGNGGTFYKKIPALSCFDEGKHSQKTHSDLIILETDISITKQYPSAFFKTNLESILKEKGVDTLLITGVTTSGCIRATCIDSISSDFITIVVSDAVGDRAAEPHEANLFDMSAKYADLMDTDQAINLIRKSLEV
jgi:maleamate amidohydrolase